VEPSGSTACHGPHVLRDARGHIGPVPHPQWLPLAPPEGSCFRRSIETRHRRRGPSSRPRDSGPDADEPSRRRRRRKRPHPAGCGARQAENCPAPWPVAGAGDFRAEASALSGADESQRGRLFCSLTIRLFVTLQKCGSGTIHLHERGPLRKGIVTGGGRPRRETLRPPAQDGPARIRTHPRPSPAGPRRRVGVVKSRRARGGCLGVISIAGVEGCDKSGGAAQRASIPECPRRPGELKHLSTRRNGKQPRLPQ
jgi:hypothetical protein